ncbi:MAG: HAD hydrolase family protein [Clostridiaceae bacterium]|nr:HAD hydrolase family protein [Clostridiaceae bacterium]
MDLRGVDTAALDKIAGDFPTLRIQGYTDSALVTFQHINARKETALTAVMEQLNVSPNEVAAFGDDRNDIEMLCICGVKVAVANALDEVKAVADYVCGDCDEDGVARWLEVNVL